MSINECPCYKCIVRACCTGAYPTPEKWEEVKLEAIEYFRSKQYDKDWEEFEQSTSNLNYIINEDDMKDVQAECEMFVEWIDNGGGE